MSTLVGRLRGLAMEWGLVGLAAGIFALLLVQLVIVGRQLFDGQIFDLPSSGMILVSLIGASALTRSARIRVGIEDLLEHPGLILAAISAGLVIGGIIMSGATLGSPDEQTHLFQARLFAQGQVVGHYPLSLLDRMLAPSEQNYFIRLAADGRAVETYWPGWALLLTPLTLLGVPWLLGPLCAIGSAALMGQLAAVWGGSRARSVALLLAGLSGAFLVTGISLLPAGGHLFLNLLFAWLLVRSGWRSALLAGLVGGLALTLHNPVPHIAFAIPWIIWMLLRRRHDAFALALGYLPGVLLFVGWIAIQSSFYQPGLDHNDSASWLAHALSILRPPSTQSVEFRFWELMRAWSWSVPGLLVLSAVGWWRLRHQSGALLLGASFVLTVIAYTLYPDPRGQGIGYGARYFHSAWGALPVLAALLLVMPGRERLRQTILAAGLTALLLVLPVQFLEPYAIAQQGRADLQTLEIPGADLIFVDFDKTNIPVAYLIGNHPDLSGVLILHSEGTASDQILVDNVFPGARMLVSTPFGESYARP